MRRPACSRAGRLRWRRLSGLLLLPLPLPLAASVAVAAFAVAVVVAVAVAVAVRAWCCASFRLGLRRQMYLLWLVARLQQRHDDMQGTVGERLGEGVTTCFAAATALYLRRCLNSSWPGASLPSDWRVCHRPRSCGRRHAQQQHCWGARLPAVGSSSQRADTAAVCAGRHLTSGSRAAANCWTLITRGSSAPGRNCCCIGLLLLL